MPRNYPEITVGLGKFTPDLFNRLMVMLQAFEQERPIRNRLDGTASPERKRSLVIGKIISSESYSTGRFKYQFKEVLPGGFSGDSPDRDFVFKNGAEQLDAYNLIEFENTSSFAGPGINLAADDFPAGMSLRAIADDTLVLVYIQRDAFGKEVGFFNCANAIDGSCD